MHGVRGTLLQPPRDAQAVTARKVLPAPRGGAEVKDEVVVDAAEVTVVLAAVAAGKRVPVQVRTPRREPIADAGVPDDAKAPRAASELRRRPVTAGSSNVGRRAARKELSAKMNVV